MLTSGTVNRKVPNMANNLTTEKKVTAVAMLAEGNSIRAIERMTGVHRDNDHAFRRPVGDVRQDSR
jgi:hypothetical protein